MFNPKTPNTNGTMIYKTLYINEETIKEAEYYANKNKISLNSLLTQMIEHCLDEMKNQK